MDAVRRATVVLLLAVACCREPAQSPPLIEPGRPPPRMIEQPVPRPVDDEDTWGPAPPAASSAALPTPPTTPVAEIPDVKCPRGTTKVGTRCIGEVVCPTGTLWNGQVCTTGSTCTLQINSIPQSTVLVDDNPVGLTPRVGYPVLAGSHAVTFVHDTLGKKVVTATCAAGEVKGVYVKLVD
jgi:hypothetical protein